MVYMSGFVVCVLVKGKVCHELNGLCELCEGDEYTVRLRNKTDRRAACELFIDGELQGNYVVNAKSHIDVQRGVTKNAAFKFAHIDSSESIDQGKNGITTSSGKIRALFRFERIEPVYQPIYTPWIDNNGKPWINKSYQPYKFVEYPTSYGWTTNNPNVVYGTNTPGTCKGLSSISVNSCAAPSYGNYTDNAVRRDVGVTVDGSKTQQSFYTTNFPLEYTYAAVIELQLRLKQEGDNTEVIKGKNIYKNVYCGQCGAARESARARFCVNCGHKLST